MEETQSKTRLRLIVAVPAIMFLFTMGASFLTVSLLPQRALKIIGYRTIFWDILPWVLPYGIVSVVVGFLLVFGITKDLKLPGLERVDVDEG